MKLSTLTALTIIAVSSTSFAFVKDTVTCKSSNKKIELTISSSNRPDFDLSKYDSSSAANSDEYGTVELSISKKGQPVAGQIKILSATEGQSTGITELDDAGRTCVLGTLTKNIEAKARLTIKGQSRDVKLTCEDEFKLSSYSIECI